MRDAGRRGRSGTSAAGPNRRSPRWTRSSPAPRAAGRRAASARHADRRRRGARRCGSSATSSARGGTAGGRTSRRRPRMQRALMLQDLAQDVRIGVRSLLRAPVLTLTIVVTVGLGIGATTAIFSAINAALLRPLPYAASGAARADLHRHAAVQVPLLGRRLSGACGEQQTQFEQVATYTDRAMTFSDGDAGGAAAGRRRVVDVLLGARHPARDRAATSPRPTAARAARRRCIVSHAFWQQRLGGRPMRSGSPIRLDGADHTLVGVLPRGSGPLERRQDLFVVAAVQPAAARGPVFLHGDRTAANRRRPRRWRPSELRAINRRIFPIWKTSYQDDRATWSMEDLKSAVVGDVEHDRRPGARGGGAGLADRVRERVEPAHRAGHEPAPGAGGARGARRLARARRALPARRERACSRAGAVRWASALAWAGVELLRSVGANYFPANAGDRARRAGAVAAGGARRSRAG